MWINNLFRKFIQKDTEQLQAGLDKKYGKGVYTIKPTNEQSTFYTIKDSNGNVVYTGLFYKIAKFLKLFKKGD